MVGLLQFLRDFCENACGLFTAVGGNGCFGFAISLLQNCMYVNVATFFINSRGFFEGKPRLLVSSLQLYFSGTLNKIAAHLGFLTPASWQLIQLLMTPGTKAKLIMLSITHVIERGDDTCNQPRIASRAWTDCDWRQRIWVTFFVKERRWKKGAGVRL